jgi:NitT/TauT family transport system substrate-binding protein
MQLRIMVTRHSAFYSPLLATFAAGFLQEEGLDATYHLLPAGRAVGDFLAAGEVDVAQSAVSYSWSVLEKGGTPQAVHFAQINQRDGFFIAARNAAEPFDWPSLLQGKLMYVHGGQPEAMLRYALHRGGVDLGQVTGVNAGDTNAMLKAFRDGQADFFHEQAPYPQQLEADGLARVAVSVGEAIGDVAFSSLAATPGWLQRDEAKRFMRAYRKARAWVRTAAPVEIADRLQALFPGTARSALERGLAAYQHLGCWAGEPVIAPGHYARALEAFEHARLVTRRWPREGIVVPAPDTV